MDFTTADVIMNPDHRNEYVRREDGHPASLRDLIMSMEIEVEVVRFKEGKREKKKVKDKLFLTIDETYRKPGTYTLVFPKAYKKEAENRVRGLYVYIRQMVLEVTFDPTEVDQDIKDWFKEEAVEEARGMYIENGKLCTQETTDQDDAIQAVDAVPWYRGETAEEEPGETSTIPTIDKTTNMRKATFGDTPSIHTAATSATNTMSNALTQAINKAKEMGVNDQTGDPENIDLSGTNAAGGYLEEE